MKRTKCRVHHHLDVIPLALLHDRTFAKPLVQLPQGYWQQQIPLPLHLVHLGSKQECGAPTTIGD